MALSQKRKFQDMNLDNLQHLLECSLCFHEFDEGELKPKFLICSHTFCQKCLQALSFSMKILCPLCRTTTPVGKGVSYLATNNYVLHILRTSNSTDLAILVSKCEEKDSQILQLQTANQLLEIKNQELEEKMKQQQLQAPKLVLDLNPTFRQFPECSKLIMNSTPIKEEKKTEPPKKKLVIKLVRKQITKETNPTPIKVESIDDIDTFIRNFRSQLKQMGMFYNDVVTWGARNYPGLNAYLISRFMTKKLPENQVEKWKTVFQNFLADVSVDQPANHITPVKKPAPVFPKSILQKLEDFFNANPTPEPNSLSELSRKLRISPQRIEDWFSKK